MLTWIELPPASHRLLIEVDASQNAYNYSIKPEGCQLKDTIVFIVSAFSVDWLAPRQLLRDDCLTFNKHIKCLLKR